MTAILSYLKRHHLALLCLVLVLGGGTAYASKPNVHLPKNSVASKQVKNGSLTSADLKDGSLTGADLADDSVTGADVQEGSLGRVPSAANADSVGGTGLDGLLRTSGCQRGKLLGSALILADGAIETTFSTTGVSDAYNCAPGAVEVRRQGTGRHLVRFTGNQSNTATVQVRFDQDGADEATCATVKKVSTGADTGAFSVTTFDCSSDSVVNSDFTLTLS